MTETYGKSSPKTSTDSSASISSAALAAGSTPSTSPDGETDLFGLPVAHARHFPSQENELSAQRAKARALCGALDELASQYAEIASTHGSPTSGTYGRKFGGLPRDLALDGFTESRLTRLMPSCGSTLYKHRLDFSATPLGRRVYRLRASALPTSDSGCGGWPTPMAGTPAQRGYNEAGNTDSSRKTVALAGWATPSARDGKDTPGMKAEGTNPDGSTRNRLDQLPRQAHGTEQNSSHAPTEKRGQLSPAFSLWLQGYPPEWLSCAPRETRSSRK